MARGAPGRNAIAAQVTALRNLNQQAAAALLGVPVRSLRDWNAPRNEKTRTYDGPELVKWLLGRERSKRKPVDLKVVAEQLQNEKLREMRRRNDLEEGLLVEIETVGSVLNDAFAAWREQVKSFEAKFGKDAGDAVRGMIELTFNDARKIVEPKEPKEPKSA